MRLLPQLQHRLVAGAARPALRNGRAVYRPTWVRCNSNLLISNNRKAQTLGDILAEAIKTTGPISLAQYMRQCLTNPTAGYYINKDPLGARGDFITSPEISQMFGELVGVWVLAEWMAQGSAKQIRLVELGPGRGTLMNDLLRAARSFAPFHAAIASVHMVEASPTLRAAQHALLCEGELEKTEKGYRGRTAGGLDVFWAEVLEDVPTEGGPAFVVAHEFFDALPIHQFERTAKGWRELQVDFSAAPKESTLSLPGQSGLPAAPKFHLTLPPHATPSAMVMPASSERYRKLPVGSKVEICPEAWAACKQICGLMAGGGAALVVDYGTATIPVDTLRGIKAHRIVSPFEEPGLADLSADVDFGALAEVAEAAGVAAYGPVDQGDFLHAMGIGARATMLAEAAADEAGVRRVEQAYLRLTEKAGGAMGKTYKALALLPSGRTAPVGFGGQVE
ncbi:S-adenosyl-L-methionine-dependent methyltransferase [Dipodascopsis tothii]|uniref:S-adenosyl-L-methionine-dependent methyltransferase n=1 Tax=Dipodascopsis tothii TaxID=44089 RepID=UPI0034CEECDC